MYIKDVLVREFTENLLFSEEIYGKIFLQAAEGLAQIFLARITRAQCFLSLCSQQVWGNNVFCLLFIFLPCNYLWNETMLIGAKASQISSVEIRYCLSSTAKPRSTPKLWLPFHNIVIIWQLSGLCASEVGSKTIHQDVLLERRWLIWYNDYSVIYTIPSANKRCRPPPAARP